MINKRAVRAVLFALSSICLMGCTGGKNVAENTPSPVPATSTPTGTPSPTAMPADIYEGIVKKGISAGVSVHDPSIFAADDGYYIYGSHMANAFTTDLRKFKYCGNGYNSANKMFVNLFADDCGIFDYAGKKSGNEYAVWAPHVIYNRAMGKYCMYMCTSSTYIKSSICFATSDSPAGPFKWEANILYSGFTLKELSQTNVLSVVSKEKAIATYLNVSTFNNQLWPNCIDPTVFYDKDGRMWMVYGSWSGGIFLIEIDEATGYPIHPEEDTENGIDPYFGKRLIGGNHKSIEGPYIQYDPDAGYYYLFVSYGGLEAKGGYQMRVFRATDVLGPYVDMNGAYPQFETHAKYGLKLSGNYRLPSLTKAYMATGGQSAFEDTDGKTYLCFHTRFENSGEFHEPRVQQYFINAEGWPVMAPYATSGETLSDTNFTVDEMAGIYYLVNMGTSINANISEPVLVELKADGTVTGENLLGTWTFTKDSPYMTISYEDVTYSGVFVRMKDQAGTDVMCFTAVGGNTSVWGVKYLK